MTKHPREELFQVTLKNTNCLPGTLVGCMDPEEKHSEENSCSAFRHHFIGGNVNDIMRGFFFCMFYEKYQIRNYVGFSAEL